MKPDTLLVTGGAGFIGSALVRHLINDTEHTVINIDALTYAGNLSSLGDARTDPRHIHVDINICDRQAIADTIAKYKPTKVLHLAAESHVDRSIDGPEEFIQTNIVGTFNLLEESLAYWKSMDKTAAADFRFLHISTDEVFGSLGETGLFSESTPYDPRSPYSASKASSDMLVRAWYHTYDMPVLITNCSNNYGEYQYPEKLIPVIILRALAGQDIPVYGDGGAIRDWLYVGDHVSGILKALEKGVPGETYNIGTNNERSTVEMVEAVCAVLDAKRPLNQGSYADQLVFVTDRPGHDRRYAIDASKIKKELGWEPSKSFDEAIDQTVSWYLNNLEWCTEVTDGAATLERIGTRK